MVAGPEAAQLPQFINPRWSRRVGSQLGVLGPALHPHLYGSSLIGSRCSAANAFVTPRYASRNSTAAHHAASIASDAQVQRPATGSTSPTPTCPHTFSDDEPIASGYVAYRGAFPLSEIDVELDENALKDVVVYVGPGCHLVQYPLRGGEMFNTVAVFKSPAYERGASDWGNPDELDAVFSGMCADVRRGLKSLWRTRKWPMYDRMPIPTWVDGRLALTGDAAHPMLQYLAQGACQAIEDAHVLATEATRTSTQGGVDWDRTLKAYEAARTGRTARVQASARVWGDLWHVDGIARLLRNELLRDRAPGDYKHIDWLYGS